MPVHYGQPVPIPKSEIQSRRERFNNARMLKDYIANIRAQYTENFTSEDIVKRQKAVATYMIDKLGIRTGIKVDAMFFGCCNIKVENIKAIPPNSFEYTHHSKINRMLITYEDVEAPVCEAIVHFQAGKQGGDDLFDKLNSTELTAHLNELMPGLTDTVFRTYNASVRFDNLLNKEPEEGDATDKHTFFSYARMKAAPGFGNKPRAITILKPDHPRLLQFAGKIAELKASLTELEKNLDRAKDGNPHKLANEEEQESLLPEVLEKKIVHTRSKISYFELLTKKHERPSEMNGYEPINTDDYFDPRISIAWWKRNEISPEDALSKRQLEMYPWAMDVLADFRF